ESPIEKELVNTFATVGNFTLKPDGTEVCEGRWWTIAEIEAAFGKDILTPNFEYEFPKIKQSLLALL
ncbi:MAG: NTP pyrophosphohydrolase, partial [Bacteroidales bacterium]|nr:NTP pyrophosphohydrolase [Bacteroidales bacterium]